MECPACESIFDATFPTGAYDEDGLADLEDLTAKVHCPNTECGEEFEAEYTGWTNYGDA